MKGVILSGGKGTRLSPLTDNYPKQLVPVLGKPILMHCIEYLRKSGIKDICVTLSPETGKIIEQEVTKQNYDTNITYIYQDQPKGLADAVNITKEFVADTENFVVLLGDNLFDKPISELATAYKKSQADTLILLKEVERPYDFGVAKFDSTGKVETVVEKPKQFISHYALVGAYVFNKKIFEAIKNITVSKRGELEITDAISHQVSSGLKVQTSILESFWFDSGTLEGLLDANKRMLINSSKFDNINSFIKDSYLLGNIASHENTRIEDSNLMGPIHIGKNVKIINSVIGPFTTIADNCVVENSELQETIIMDRTSILNSKVISSLLFKELEISNEPVVINKILA